MTSQSEIFGQGGGGNGALPTIKAAERPFAAMFPNAGDRVEGFLADGDYIVLPFSSATSIQY